jgi:hypothetical protein
MSECGAFVFGCRVSTGAMCMEIGEELPLDSMCEGDAYEGKQERVQTLRSES